MKSPAHDPTQPARTITLIEAVAAMHDKRFSVELEEEHQKAVAHMVNKGGKAVLTLTIAYEPADEGVNITGDIKLKLPPKARRKEFYYATEEGKTCIDSPAHTELPFPSLVKSTGTQKAAGQ